MSDIINLKSFGSVVLTLRPDLFYWCLSVLLLLHLLNLEISLNSDLLRSCRLFLDPLNCLGDVADVFSFGSWVVDRILSLIIHGIQWLLKLLNTDNKIFHVSLAFR